jgi:predicted nucleic acid-binding protein
VPDGEAVVDASLVVDLVLGGSAAAPLAERLDALVLHAPAHIDAEVLSAIGRLHRAGTLSTHDATERLELALELPIERRLLDLLVPGAWKRRQRLRLVDALYVELAAQLDVPLLTTDVRLARATRIAQVVA